MKLINNAAEFKAFYPYKSPPNPEPCPAPKDYPTSYPCFCRVVEHLGDLCADYKEIQIAYPPRGGNVESYYLGLKKGIEFGRSE